MCSMCFILSQCRIQALNEEIHVNLVNALLTGLSCNDIRCVLQPLHAIFQVSQQHNAAPQICVHKLVQCTCFAEQHSIFTDVSLLIKNLSKAK